MPEATMSGEALENLISATVAAPSLGHSQPWRIRLDPDTTTLEVRAAPGRDTSYAEHADRVLHIAVGAALFNLRLAAAELGQDAGVRLLPDPGDPDLLASLRLTRPRRRGQADDRALYDALWHLHDSRFGFSGRPVPAGVLAELADAARTEGALLVMPGPAETDRLVRLSAEADRRGPGHGLGDVRGEWEQGRGERRRTDREDRAYHRDAAPAIGLLTTPFDRPEDWLRAGEALERVLLTATARSVRSSLLHQALGWADLRRALYVRQADRGERRHPQMLLRVGYGPEAADLVPPPR